jgi:type I restriction-modification system DNA methylase subunit
MRFDFVISNPPFNAGPTKGNLHLRMMEKCVQMSDEKAYNWCLDHYKGDDFDKWFEIVD